MTDNLSNNIENEKSQDSDFFAFLRTEYMDLLSQVLKEYNNLARLIIRNSQVANMEDVNKLLPIIETIEQFLKNNDVYTMSPLQIEQAIEKLKIVLEKIKKAKNSF